MNEITGRFTGLPITSTVRGWATEIPLKSLKRLKRPGVALVDQDRSWSYIAGEVNFRGETVTAEELNAAKYAIRSLLQL
ncbi:MAG: mRNA interferase MazF [Caballeronia sp.]|nr:mRNA interferase MazF [Caballeronia sp.]